MKQSLFLLFFFSFLLMLLSCHKSLSNRVAAGTVSGRWQIVTDSTTEGVGADNRYVVYQGEEGDYYNFGSDSILTVKEGDSFYTYIYMMTTDTSLSLFTPDDRFHTWPIAYSIIDPTTHTMNLLNEWMLTPGGILGRSVYLKR